MQKFISLKTKFLTLLLGSVFVMSLVACGIAVIHAKKLISQNSQEIITLIAQNKKTELDEIITSIEQSVETLYGYSQSFLPKDLEKMKDPNFAGNYIEKVKALYNHAIQSTDGALAAYLRLAPEIKNSKDVGIFLNRIRSSSTFFEAPLTDIASSDKNDLEHVGWFYKPIESKAAIWMGPYHNSNIGYDMMSFVIPLFVKGKAVGVVGMDVEKELFNDAVNQKLFYKTASIVLLAKDGSLVYHKDYQNGLPVFKLPKKFLHLTKLIGPFSKDTKTIKYNLNGNEKIMLVKPLKNGLRLVLTVEQNEINASRRELLITSIIAFVILFVIATILGYILVNQITKPLAKLTEVAKAVERGNLKANIQVKSNDELGLFAQVLNKALQEVQKNIDYIKSLAYEDPLTGLLNKQSYTMTADELDKKIKADPEHTKFSLILMDITNLQYLTENYGQGRSESMVVAAVSILKTIFPSEEIFRLYDDGFAIVLKTSDDNYLNAMQLLIKNEINSFNDKRSNGPEPLNVAIGSACFNYKNNQDFNSVFYKASTLMYKNKLELNNYAKVRDDAIKMLNMIFHKILRVNLATDEFFEIKVYQEEKEESLGYSNKISEWMYNAAQCGLIYQNDITKYLEFTNIASLREKIKQEKNYLSIRYRRKVNDEYRWVKLEILKCSDYTEEQPVVMVYVRDIHETYAHEHEYKQKLEFLSNNDTLTGLYNRYYLKNYFQKYAHSGEHCAVGLLFFDLNGLKVANDTLGHQAGDELIIKMANLLKECFANHLCCRLSGDEFVVVTKKLSEHDFDALIEKFKALNTHNDHPLCAFGKAYKAKATNLSELLTKAENNMYLDKKAFYQKFPHLKR